MSYITFTPDQYIARLDAITKLGTITAAQITELRMMRSVISPSPDADQQAAIDALERGLGTNVRIVHEQRPSDQQPRVIPAGTVNRAQRRHAAGKKRQRFVHTPPMPQMIHKSEID